MHMVFPILETIGAYGLLKCLLKLLSGKRNVYLILKENQVVHLGWIALGFCRFYDVEPGSAVIGPVWTDGEHRGRGLATVALVQVMNRLTARSVSVFYIDTSEQNLAMQRVIGKCGFGLPILKIKKRKK